MRKTIYLFALCLFFTFPISLHAQWTKTNGLPGGSTNQLLNYGDTVLTSTGGELYYSANHGENWLPILNPSLQNPYLLASDGENVVGFAHNLDWNFAFPFRTDDFFQTLHPISTDTLILNWFFPAHGYIYAQRYQYPNSGLYRTNNDGATWDFVTPRSLGYLQFNDQRITGVSSKFVLQSIDEGFTWDTLLQFVGYANRLLQYENHFFLFTFSTASTTAGCYASDDYGQTWQFHQNADLEYINDFIWHNGSIYGLDGFRIIQTYDLGQTWQGVPLPANSAYPANLGISSGNTLIIGGAQSVGSPGMHRSIDDGNTWNPASSGLVTSSGKLRKFNDDLFVPSPGGLYKANADEVNWTIVDLDIPQPPNHYWIISDFVKTGNNWLLSDGQGIWVSEDQGNSWLKSWVQPGQANLPAEVLELENINNKVIAHGPWQGYDAYYYYISEDNGLTFHFIETLFEQKQTKIGLLEVAGDKVYVLGYDQKIYRSDDACATWVLQSDNLQTSGCGSPGSDVLAASLHVSGNVIAVNADYSKKIHFSKDAGQSWTCYDLETTGSPWGNSIITDLQYVGNRLLASTQKGIYLSENDGSDWIDWNDGLLTNHITDIEAHNGFIWASSKGGGIWKRPISELGMSNTLSPGFFIDSLKLSPNPASQLVQIETGSANGEIRILDAMGRIVLQQSVNEANTAISVEAFPLGVYQVIFTCEKGIHLGSLVVQR